MSRIGFNIGGGDSFEAMHDGAKLAAANHDVVLFGHPDVLARADSGFLRVETGHILPNGVDVEKEFRHFKQEPMRRLAVDLKKGHIDAVVDCGNTAVTVAAGTIGAGRIKGVIFPALPFDVPTITHDAEGNPTISSTLLLDVGASKDPTPEMLYGFARMASILLGDQPTIKVLGMGAEDSKGTKTTQEALKLIRADEALNTLGMGEGYSAFDASTRVLVTESQTGNVLIKSAKQLMGGVLGQVWWTFNRTPEAMEAKETVRPDVDVFKKLQPETLGAALLLGVKGVIYKGNGSSSAVAVAAAFDQAEDAIQSDLIDRLSSEFGK